MSEMGWSEILDGDERILWQGRPDSQIALKTSDMLMAGFGLFFAGFAVVWMSMAAASGGSFWVFGLLHFAVGVGISLWAVFGGAYRRARTWYTLTSKRALIATQMPIVGRKLQFYPITTDTPLELEPGPLSSVYFATRQKRSKNGTYTVPVGFERIAEGAEVLKLLRSIQSGTPSAE